MKITIDDVQKTVEVEGEVTLYELFKSLDGMKISLKEYSLVPKKEIQWWPIYPQTTPWLPWYTTNPTIGTEYPFTISVSI